MRTPFVVLMLAVGVAACDPGVPESGAGGYNSYMRNTDTSGAAAAPSASTTFSTDSVAAAIDSAQPGGTAPLNPTGQNSASPQPMVTGKPATGQIIGGQVGVQGAATGAAALPPIDQAACAGRGNAFAGIQETTSEMNYASGGVSDEQDFKAVTGRETIASDKQRIECNREQIVVVQPGALPERPGNEGPNIAAYALSTTNAPGVKLYSRPPFYLTNPEKACAKFASPDLAQAAFLAAGGPQRDPKALDPDGDGFACSWDPRPFRNANK